VLLLFAVVGVAGAIISLCCGPLGRLKVAPFICSSCSMCLSPRSQRSCTVARQFAQTQIFTEAASAGRASSVSIDDVRHLRQACVGTEEESVAEAAPVRVKRSVGERPSKARFATQ
jgi:hypothetical protein